MTNQTSVMSRKPLPGNGVSGVPTLWIVGSVDEDRAHGSVFDQFPWRTHRVRNRSEFARHMHSGHARVVVCERDLPDGDWRDVLEIAASMLSPPPVIVTSRLADEYLWAEVLNLGGYDVLAKPLDRQEVGRSLNLAWERWTNPRNSAQHATSVPVCKGDPILCSTA